MKLFNKNNKKRLQVLIPMCAFVLAVVIVLFFVIPSTKDLRINEQAEDRTPDTQMIDSAYVEEKAENTEAAECRDSQINDFFTQYYQAMADGNVTAMGSMYDAEGYAATSEALSTLIEGYENIRVYTAEGLREDELAAFVYSDVRFHNIDTPAPSVESFYLNVSDDSPKIMTDMYTDKNIADYLTKLSVKNPVKSIMENTNFWLQTNLKNDNTLNEIYNKMKEYTSQAEENAD